MPLDTSRFYRLPWSREDSPNGWIEPTTHCQLRCPDCYRGTDRAGFQPVHGEPEAVKREIDELIRLRNIQTLTISGGDPLLYPDLDEIVRYAREKALEVMVLTNGVLLDRARVVHLRSLGVGRVVIHIDRHQGRAEGQTESELNGLRATFCELFREVQGITLGFLMPLSAEDIGDLDVLIPFFRRNSDVVRVAMFTVRQELILGGAQYDPARRPAFERIAERVRELYGLEYAAYLPKRASGGIAWLVGIPVFSGSRTVGSIGAATCRWVQEENRKRHGHYVVVGNRMPASPGFLFHVLVDPSLRAILFRHLLRRRDGPLHHQVVILLNTPEKTNGIWDFCQGCPDAILHQGKLVPSCLLENAKAGEDVAL